MQQTTAKETALNIFAIFGFIALLIAGLWATIQLMQIVFSYVGTIPFSKNGLAPLASLSTSSISMQLQDSTVEPGKAFTVGWNGTNILQGGTLAFTYACREGLFLKVAASSDTEYAIPCNAPYTIPKEALILEITPIVSRHGQFEVPLTLSYTEGNKVAKDTAQIRINNTQKAPVIAQTPSLPQPAVPQPIAASTKPIPSPAQKAPQVAPETLPAPVKPALALPVKPIPKPVTVEKPVQKSSETGFIDLDARILAVGKLASKDVVSPRTSFTKNEMASVTFEIINNGTKAVTGWVYSLSLPTEPAYTYVSEAQPTLYAGSRATVTLSFDKLKTGSNRIILIADPAKKIMESARANNEASVVVSVE